MVGWIHQEGTVFCVQPLIDICHDQLRLADIRKSADNGKTLGIEPEAGFGGCANARAVLRKAPDEAVAVPTQTLYFFLHF